MLNMTDVSFGLRANKNNENADVFPPVAMLTMLRVNEIREKQRSEGNFDCFGKAATGCCDQTACTYYAECMDISQCLTGLES
jgi:hypothetical protein